MAQPSRLSIQRLSTLFFLPLTSLAIDFVQRNECYALDPIIITYTTTVYATGEQSHNNPSVTNEAALYQSTVISSASLNIETPTSNPYPLPVEVESCFNRSNTAHYLDVSHHYHATGVHTSSAVSESYHHSTHHQDSYSGKSTSPHSTLADYYHTAPPYGTPNATSAIYPTASGISSTTSIPNNTTLPTPPPCVPRMDLDGVSEYGFNKKNAPFSIRITGCSKFDVNQTTALANFQAIPSLIINADAISLSGFLDDYVLLSVFALDTNGYPIIKSWELHFGSVNMPILILDPDDTPAQGVRVEANATVYPGLTGSCTTDAAGKCTIENLPGTTIGLVARKDDNSIAVNGLAPTTVQVTMKLLPFLAPKPGASFDIDNGTVGWTGGTLQQSLKIKRDTTLLINTNGQFTLQSASNSFPASKDSKKAFIKYRFITSEVPGGFFGTEFNDYFTVTIRTDTGAFTTVTNSMNALGLGAFDSSGATNVFTLTLDIPANTMAIAYDIGVANVADNLLDSSLVVEKVGENNCDKCNSCTECPERPACQKDCITPRAGSCAFYADCAEKELKCGSSGYPVRYGQKNCLAFSKNIDFFTPAGRDFVWATMSCLQRFLSPLIRECSETCDSLRTKAFASHPSCYTDSGFCGLGCGDIIVLLAIVNKDLLESGTQIWDTGKICLTQKLETLTGCAGELFVGTAAAATFGVGLVGGSLVIAAEVAGRYLGGLATGFVRGFF